MQVTSRRRARPLFLVHVNSNRPTYLRGVAALGVLTIHYGGLGLFDLFHPGGVLDRFFSKLVILGGQGPTMFFVASGFVLYESIKKVRIIGLFILTRYFRLMPLYLFVSAISVVIQGLQVDVGTAILKLFFLDIFFKSAYDFAPLNISFFIVMEFWLSLSLLFTYLIPKRMSGIRANVYFLVLLFSSFTVHILAGELSQNNQYNSYYLEILRFQFWFIAGSLAKIFTKQINYKLFFNFAAFVAIICAFYSSNYIGYFVGFGTIFFLLGETPKKAFMPLIFVGNICYSIYLNHQPAYYFFSKNFFMEPLLILGLVILISIFTFVFIEVPFTKLGRRLVHKLFVRP